MWLHAFETNLALKPVLAPHNGRQLRLAAFGSKIAWEDG